MSRTRPALRRHALCLGLVAGIIIPVTFAAAQDVNQLIGQCAAEHDETDDEVIAACTALIAMPQLDTKQRSLAFSNRAAGYQGKNDLDRALADANEAIKIDPTSAQAFFRRGDVYKNQNQNDLALQDLTEAIRLDPKVPVYFVDRSNIYATKHQYDLAIRDLDQALQLDPKDEIQAIVNRCNVLTFKGDFDAALADCRKGIEQHPHDYYAQSRLAFLYYRMNRVDDSIATYDAALAFPDLDAYGKAFLLYGRGLAKLKKGDQRGGEADMTAAKALSKDIALDFE
jgi:tetratricopeptide (TPR) repeat protein